MKETTIICQIQDFEANFFMERKPQNPEIRNNPENFTHENINQLHIQRHRKPPSYY